jgi:hypothetical protein
MNKNIVLAAAVLAIAGCATHKTSDQPAAATAPSTQAQNPGNAPDAGSAKKSNNPPGEIVGVPAPNSKFARLKLGMTLRDVNALIGTPDDMSRHETGKRWIPFYFGPDAQRMEALYNKEGCLTYTGGNVFGGGDNQLIRIAADPKATCWNPG